MENNFKFYNTLSRQVENVIPNEDGKIAMYRDKIIFILFIIMVGYLVYCCFFN